MSKKINQYAPILYLIILIIIFFTIIVNLFYRKVIMPQENHTVTNEVIDESKKIDLRARYPYSEKENEENDIGLGEKIINWSSNIKVNIDTYASTLLPNYDKIFECYRKYNRSIAWNYNIADLNQNGILTLDNGYLSYACKEVNAEELNYIPIKVKKFADFLDEYKINFYYINGGYKVPKEEKNLPSYNRKFEKTAFNGSILMELLKKQGINLLDIREEAKKDKKNWYSLFYKQDHHMKTDVQLWVASKIAELLTEKEGYRFAKNLFSLSEYNLVKTNTMFGSQARGILKSGLEIKPEEYTKVTPKFDTYFEIELPTKGKIRKGSYENSLFDNDIYKRSLQTDFYSISHQNGYGCAIWKNNDLGIIRNKIPNFNKGKKVMIIQDSFGCYTSPYLAQGIEEMHLIYLPTFTGSIRSYIKNIKPDVVLMLYNEGVAQKYEDSKESDFFKLD